MPPADELSASAASSEALPESDVLSAFSEPSAEVAKAARFAEVAERVAEVAARVANPPSELDTEEP